jgi:probable rRNA maturation factor
VPIELDNRHATWDSAAVDLEALLAPVARGELGCEPTVSVVFTGDEEMAELNAQWLAHEGPTDVLSFPQFELRPGDAVEGLVDGALLGDVVISIDTAAEQAADFESWSTADEVALLFVHGLLHLCGYDDGDDASRHAMREREDEVLVTAGRSKAPRYADSAP